MEKPATSPDEIRIDTPLGPLAVVLDAAGVLHAARFVDAAAPASQRPLRPAETELRARLAAYFDGELAAVQGLMVAPAGTAFQTAVWGELRRTRPGETLSYGALAGRLGLPAHRAARAVGAANAANPIALVIPCHRVIAADGRPLGYAWGVARKRWLLRHEAAHAGTTPHGDAGPADAPRG